MSISATGTRSAPKSSHAEYKLDVMLSASRSQWRSPAPLCSCGDEALTEITHSLFVCWEVKFVPGRTRVQRRLEERRGLPEKEEAGGEGGDQRR